MTRLPARNSGSDHTVELDIVVGDVERRLAGLAEALHKRDTEAIESNAAELHRALANAVQCFMHVAAHGGVPEPLRRRLARASAAVARQRESLARATAALDRAIDVLLPREAGGVYSAHGTAERPASSGGAFQA